MVSYALVSSGPGSFAQRKQNGTQEAQKTQEVGLQTIFLCSFPGWFHHLSAKAAKRPTRGISPRLIITCR
jgi:hypothetical protein